MARTGISGFPNRAALIEHTYLVIKNCGSSATNDEIYEHVIKQMSLPEHIIDLMCPNGVETKLQCELRWARTYLKKRRVIDNSKRGIWSISPDYINVQSVSGSDVEDYVRNLGSDISQMPKKVDTGNIVMSQTDVDKEEIQDSEPWRSELSTVLHNMDWFAFERLCKRLLRECGFSQVEVTKKTGDNGIDGYGKIKLNGLVSINVAFQCKRQKVSISNQQIRDFRGSLNANVEKGIFITTASFTKSAIDEAQDSAKKPQIDLIDGEELIGLLIEHELGIEPFSVYKVNREFYKTI